ncbi:hypothetical protein GEW_01973, partial [Pasteurella multocida subsp. gallicida str. Anand1_poultry]
WDESIRADMQQRQQNVAFFPHCHLKVPALVNVLFWQ